MMPKILYEDKDIIVVIKPRGVSSQSSGGFEEDMVSFLKKHMGRDAYIGVIHRLDKPVYGIMVYGKNKKAAAILADDLRERKIEKIYEALVEGRPEKDEGKLVSYIKKDGGNVSAICNENTPGAKQCVLKYSVISYDKKEDLEIGRLRIELITGRHHQIRLQCAAAGFPLFGDYKYNKRTGTKKTEYDRILSLAAVELRFIHPINKKIMEYKIAADF